MSGADLSNANLRHARFEDSKFGGSQADHRFRATLSGADLLYADLRDAKELSCDILIEAKNWKDSCRDEVLLCGGERADLISACEVRADAFACYRGDQNEMKRWRAWGSR